MGEGMTPGQAMKDIRWALQCKQEDVAEWCGVTIADVSNFEKDLAYLPRLFAVVGLPKVPKDCPVPVQVLKAKYATSGRGEIPALGPRPGAVWTATDEAIPGRVQRRVAASKTGIVRRKPATEAAHVYDGAAVRRKANESTEANLWSDAVLAWTEVLEHEPDDAKAWYLRGYASWRQDECVAAIADFSRAIELAPDESTLYFRATALEELGRHREALADSAEAVALAPEDFWNRLLYARLLRALRQNEEAIAQYDEAFRIDPTKFETHMYVDRAAAHLATRNKASALEDLNAALGKDDQSLPALSARAGLLATLSRKEAALADYSAAIALAPDDPDLFKGRAKVLQRLRRHEEALADLDTAVQLNPSDHLAFRQRGTFHRFRRNLGAALSDYSRAIELAPEFALTYGSRAGLFVKMGDLHLAHADYDRAISLDDSDAESLRGRAHVLERLNEPHLAIADLTTAIALEPDDEEQYRNRANLHAKLGNKTEAILDFSAFLDRSANDTEVLAQRAKLRYEIGDFAAAIQDCLALEAAEAAGPTIFLLLGRSLVGLGDFAEAVGAYDQAIETNPAASELYEGRGSAKQAQADFASAEVDFTSCLEALPGHKPALLGRAVCRVRLGSLAGARSDMEQIREADDWPPGYYRDVAYVCMHIGDLDRANEYYEKYAANVAATGAGAARDAGRILATGKDTQLAMSLLLCSCEMAITNTVSNICTAFGALLDAVKNLAGNDLDATTVLRACEAQMAALEAATLADTVYPAVADVDPDEPVTPDALESLRYTHGAGWNAYAYPIGAAAVDLINHVRSVGPHIERIVAARRAREDQFDTLASTAPNVAEVLEQFAQSLRNLDERNPAAKRLGDPLSDPSLAAAAQPGPSKIDEELKDEWL